LGPPCLKYQRLTRCRRRRPGGLLRAGVAGV